MRLIDADELINAIEKSRNNNPHKDRCAMRKHDTEHAHFAKMVSDQPTAFDFANTEAFDCPCGRHYVHLAIPPKLEFCEECKEKVRNNRTDICPKCRKKLYEYEKKYNCVVDIGMNGCDGARGEKYILPHGERRRN